MVSPEADSTTIRVKTKTHQQLEVLKIHPRETFNEVIERILEERGKND